MSAIDEKAFEDRGRDLTMKTGAMGDRCHDKYCDLPLVYTRLSHTLVYTKIYTVRVTI